MYFSTKIVVACALIDTCSLIKCTCTCVFLESGSKSGAVRDDSSISGGDSVSLSPPAPRVQLVGQGTAKSKIDV